MYALASIIVTVYNEEAVIDEFFDILMPVLLGMNRSFEIICVNDGSSDRTLSKLMNLKKTYHDIKIVDLFRNFGKEAGITAGFNYAGGDILIPIDADLQDPPSLIPLLIEKWEEGFDEVIAVRRSRESDTWIKRTTANLFYKWFNKISDYKIKFNAGDYRLLDRSIVDVIFLLNEKNRFMKGLYSWSTNCNHFQAWAKQHNIFIQYIQPGKPAQNAYIERFNRTYREAVLDMYLFRNIQEVQNITDSWLKHYNEERPHESLNNQSPMNFIKQLSQNFSICELG